MLKVLVLTAPVDVEINNIRLRNIIELNFSNFKYILRFLHWKQNNMLSNT